MFFEFGQDFILGQANFPLEPLLKKPNIKQKVIMPVFWDKKKTARITVESEFIIPEEEF